MPKKDPGETLDYALDWSQAMENADAIATSTWSVESGGVSIPASTVNGKTVTVWVSGGTTNVPAIVKNTVTTTQGRTFVERLKIPVLNQ